MSHNIVPTFVFWIFRFPRGLEILYWTFFNSPFHVDFKNIQLFIILWNMDRDIGKILQGGHFKIQHFNYCLFKHVSTYELSWALMSSHKHSFWLIRTHMHSWVWCYYAISSHECWSMPMAPCSWLLLSSHECALIHGAYFLSVHGCSWMLMSNFEHSWAPITTNAHS